MAKKPEVEVSNAGEILIPVQHNEGRAVDNSRQVYDPTENTRQLNDAGNKRQDDLREMQSIYSEKIAEMQATFSEKIAELQQIHTRELMKAESARVDALRQNDTQALAFAAERQQNEALRLAEQTNQSLGDIRKNVSELQRNQSAVSGNSSGKNSLWILIVGGILLAIAVVGFVLDIVSHT